MEGEKVISVESQLDLLKRRFKHFTKIREKEYVSCCPAHGDNNPSLSISESDSEEYDEKGNKIKRNLSSCSFCRQNIEYNKL